MVTRTGRILAEIGHTLAALCGDLRDWRHRGSQPPTPTWDIPPSVQAAMTGGSPAGNTLDADTYRRMRDADPHLQPDTPIGDLIRAKPHVRLINVQLQGNRWVMVWVDSEGCSPGMEVHAEQTNGYWVLTQQVPPCSHFTDEERESIGRRGNDDHQ